MKNLKLIGAVGGAISLVLCWPLAVGQIGQNVISDGITHVSNDDVSAELVSYDRGYLSSTVQTRYSVVDEGLKQQMQAEGLPTEMVMKSEVHHDLFGLSAVSTFPEYPEYPLVIHSTTRLNGNTQYTSTLDNWHYQSEGEDGVAISVLSSKMKGTVTTLGEMTFSATIPSIAMNFASGEKVLLSNLKGEGTGKREAGFWIGNQVMTFDSFTADDSAGNSLLGIEKVSYQFQSSLDLLNSRFTSQHNIQFGKLDSEGAQVKDVHIDFTLGNVDSSSFLELSKIYQSNPNLGPNDLQQAMPYIDTLFSKGFHVTINPLEFKVNDGEFASNLKIEVPQGTDNVMQDPSLVLPALTGNLQAFISNQLVTDFPLVREGVDELMVMEMMTQNDEGYQLSADLNEGNLVFSNGKQIPLVALFMSAMMSRGF